MKIKDFLCKEAVTADLKSTSKKEVIEELVDLLVDAGSIEKKIRSKLIDVLMARESLGSTAIGQGTRLPARNAQLSGPGFIEVGCRVDGHSAWPDRHPARSPEDA